MNIKIEQLKDSNEKLKAELEKEVVRNAELKAKNTTLTDKLSFWKDTYEQVPVRSLI